MADQIDESHTGQQRAMDDQRETSVTASPIVQQHGETHTIQITAPPDNDPHGYYREVRERYFSPPENHYQEEAVEGHYDYQPQYQPEQPLPGPSEARQYHYQHQYQPESALPGPPGTYHGYAPGPRFQQAMPGPNVSDEARQMPHLNRPTRINNASSIFTNKGKGPARQYELDSDEDVDPIPRGAHQPYNENLAHDRFGDESYGLPTRKRLKLVNHEGKEIFGLQASYGHGQNVDHNIGPNAASGPRRPPTMMSPDVEENIAMYESGYIGNRTPHRARPMFFPSSPITAVPRIPRAPHPNDFHSVGQPRAYSKASGMEHTWETHMPDNPAERVPAKKRGRAAVMKRRLPIDKDGNVPKRAYGINDPENIKIVNMYENDQIGFSEISRILNNQRIREGRKPTLSICSVHARYNRTAPLLFASERRTFVPIRERRKQMKRGEQNATLEEEPLDGKFWDPERDTKLVEFVQQYDAQKWKTVADLMSEYTDSNISVNQIVNRWKII